MIGLLDPALFLPRSPGRDAERALEEELLELLRICRDGSIELPAIEDYWPHLWKELGQPLQKSLASPMARQALQDLLKRGTQRKLPGVLAGTTKVWGFRQLFGAPALAATWEQRMTQAVLRAVLSGEETVLLVRRMMGRNVTQHAASNCTLDEVTRWVLYLHAKGAAPAHVRCLHHSRNLKLRWTARFDWRLPAQEDGARYPFCPPSRWWKGKTHAFQTMKSRPVWIDARGYGWARPNIPGGRGDHWDVYITDPNVAEYIGLDQLNIVEFGAPIGEPGSIDHRPRRKRSRLRNDTGWHCD